MALLIFGHFLKYFQQEIRTVGGTCRPRSAVSGAELGFEKRGYVLTESVQMRGIFPEDHTSFHPFQYRMGGDMCIIHTRFNLT